MQRGYTFDKSVPPERLNRLAREQMKERILRDILLDLTICEIEGWNKTEYLDELILLIRSLRRDHT